MSPPPMKKPAKLPIEMLQALLDEGTYRVTIRETSIRIDFTRGWYVVGAIKGSQIEWSLQEQSF